MFKVYKSVPQKLLNIKVKDKKIINSTRCKKAIQLANKLIKDNGRLLVRPSGTEPKVRIMCSLFNQSFNEQVYQYSKKNNSLKYASQSLKSHYCWFRLFRWSRNSSRY